MPTRYKTKATLNRPWAINSQGTMTIGTWTPASLPRPPGPRLQTRPLPLVTSSGSRTSPTLLQASTLPISPIFISPPIRHNSPPPPFPTAKNLITEEDASQQISRPRPRAFTGTHPSHGACLQPHASAAASCHHHGRSSPACSPANGSRAGRLTRPRAIWPDGQHRRVRMTTPTPREKNPTQSKHGRGAHQVPKCPRPGLHPTSTIHSPACP